MEHGTIGGLFDSRKKWAEGTVASLSTSAAPFQYVYYSTSGSNLTVTSRYVDISLEFKPSVIIVTGGSASSYTGSSFKTYMSVYAPNEPIYADSNVKTVKMGIFDHDNYSSTNYNFYGEGSYIELGNGVYRIPVPTSTIYTIRWIAYE